jgi:hypothetical protein
MNPLKLVNPALFVLVTLNTANDIVEHSSPIIIAISAGAAGALLVLSVIRFWV